MLERQDGRCPICGERAAHIDHDHTVGVARAWLCQRCNIGLGHFRDRADLLERAADYIRSHASAIRDGAA